MMISRWAVLVGWASLLVGRIATATAEDSWQVLMDRAPADANVLVMIHAEKVRRSGFAQAADWNSTEAAPGGLRSILPRGEIQRVLFAARLNLIDLAQQWEAGVLETKSDASLESFAAGVHAPQETLGSTPGVRLPYDAYLLKLAPNLFGILGPADRQKAAQWARSSTAPLHSAYLQKIAGFPQTVGTEIMLGFDLLDAVDPIDVRKVMSESSVMRDSQIDADIAAPIISSIEGIALGVRVLDKATGMIRVDFTRDPAPLAKVMKPLLLERLAARGAMIEDFQSWTLDLQGNTAFLGGNFTPTGLNFVLSVVEPDLPADRPAAPLSKAPQSDTQQKLEMAEKSKQHFRKVRSLVTEVRFPYDINFPSAGAFGAWIDRQARRIDMMPILGLDPELVDYSTGVAKSLRLTAMKQRGATINAAAYSSRRGLYTDYSTGNTYVPDSQNQIQARMEASAANLSHVDIMRMIDDETADIRRRLTERYQIEF